MDKPWNKTAPATHEVYYEGDIRKEWMKKYWSYSFYISVVYVIVIYGGRRLMKNRPRYELARLLFCWNIFLAIFSLCSSIRLSSQVYHMLKDYGFTYTVCDHYPIDKNAVVVFWMHFFCISKVPELLDTIFIILRKQPLIFLHWYHHMTVMVYCWYSYAELAAPGLWFGTMNSTVHFFMYSYYAMKVIKIRLPKPVGIFITSFQLSQMVFGCIVNYVAYKAIQTGSPPCHVTMDNIKYSVLMYFSYLLLFAHFFWNAYLSGKRPSMQSLDQWVNGPMNNNNNNSPKKIK